MDWIHLAEDKERFGNEPSDSVKGVEFLAQLSLLLALQGLCSIK
jgi:hypothetical protein